MKFALGIVAVVVLGIIVFIAWSPANAPDTFEDINSETQEVTQDTDTNTEAADRSAPKEGEYAVQTDNSIVNWAGQKPLIDGYINSGSLAVSSGAVTVGTDIITGKFTIDMDTLSVSATPVKPGSESALEGHLKGGRWFDVATYPEASFMITSVTPQADNATTNRYDVSGELTMKGMTGTLEFPAEIYQDTNGLVYASAAFEFDRTKWGITAGSGSFFDDLADNAVDDMIALSFNLVAEQE